MGDDTTSQVASVLIVGTGEWATDFVSMMTTDGFGITSLGEHASVAEVMEAFADLVVVDLSRKDIAPSLCVQLRSRSAVPILAISADGLSSEESTALYALGVDMLIPRHTTARVMVARVRALLRRFPPSRQPEDDMLASGPIRLDWRRRLAWFNDEQLSLSPRELEILEALLRRPDAVVTRDQLAASTGARDDRALDVHIRGLRAKVEAHDDRRRIATVRGVGFAIRSEDESFTIDLTDRLVASEAG